MCSVLQMYTEIINARAIAVQYDYRGLIDEMNNILRLYTAGERSQATVRGRNRNREHLQSFCR